MTPFEILHPALQFHIVNTLGWSGLRPSQLEAIELVTSGRHVLLLAPTAGGKTEAAAFPILSRMLVEDWRGLSVLYICPLRALLNNLEPRLAHYAGLVGRRAALWHGDVTQGAKRQVLRDLPDILMITPESIEGMLISRRIDHCALFSGVRAVVIDELHAFAGDDRGWHLRALLTRLDRLAEQPIQRIGLSATVGNPEELASWLAGGAAADVAGRSTVSLDADVTLDHVGSLENAAVVLSRLYRGEKRLVFCDSRAKVETLASSLRQFGIRTFVSHSSLGADSRRQAEEAFASERDCVIVATSTLELGIDVGDLDRVVQIDAPGTVSSLLQRMGRTGRRPESRRNCLLLATSDKAFLNAAGIIRLWGEGYVEPVRPPPSPFHLCAQQIMALILQESCFAIGDVPGRMADAFPGLDGNDIEAVLRHMLSAGIVASDGGVLGMGVTGERLFGRRNFLALTSAFTTPLMMTVLNGRQELGQVDPVSLSSQPDRPAILLLAGRHWQVTAIDWQRRQARVEPAQASGRSRWLGASRSLHFDLCRAIHRCVTDCQVPARLSKRAEDRLSELVSEFAFLDGRPSVVIRGDNEIRWWTFAGGGANAALAAALRARDSRVIRFDDFGLDLDAPPVPLRADDIGDAMPADDATAKGIEQLKFAECLPAALAVRLVCERIQDSDGAMRVLTG